MSVHRTTDSRNRAFTLVELLVVIGIIALLISILVPSLSKARNQANSIKCANNMRQQVLAAQMFAQDNKGQLPRCPLPGDPAKTDNVRAPNAAFVHIDWGIADLEFDAGIFRYIKGSAARALVMRCPGDNGEATQGGGPKVSGDKRNISYSWNAFIRDLATTSPQGFGIRLASVPNASTKIMIAEELAPNDGYWLLYDTSSPIAPASPRPLPPRGDDYVTGRHGGQYKTNPSRSSAGSPEYTKWANSGRGNYAFFDGHVQAMTPNEVFNRPQMFFLKDTK